jgi:cytochrome c-type biogenesis protein CcmE
MTDTLDLTPREVKPRKKRKWLPVSLIAVVIVAIVLLFANALGNSSLFFKNADEAVHERDHLGSKRFQVLGTVVDGSITSIEVDGRGATQFAIVYNGVRADVVHFGDPSGLFKPGIPVVLEGKWVHQSPPAPVGCGANDGWFLSTDHMVSKHGATYTAKNPNREAQAEAAGAAGSQCATATRS